MHARQKEREHSFKLTHNRQVESTLKSKWEKGEMVYKCIRLQLKKKNGCANHYTYFISRWKEQRSILESNID